MSSNKIYLKIPIGVIYYVCDPRTPRLNLYFMQNAESICDYLWTKLLKDMPEIEPLGGLYLHFFRPYSLPTEKKKNGYGYTVTSSHKSLPETEKKLISAYIGEIEAEKIETGSTEIVPTFFFRCPHPNQAILGFDVTQGMQQEYFGETLFLWKENKDLENLIPDNETNNNDKVNEILYHLYKSILFHWNRDDVGITRANSLKYPGIEDPNKRFENFKRAVWKGEAMIQKSIYRCTDGLYPEFGEREEDEFIFYKITDSEGKETALEKGSDGTIIPIETYYLYDRDNWVDCSSFDSRICYCKDYGLTNALFRIEVVNYRFENPEVLYKEGKYIRRSNLFSHFFPNKEEQDAAIDNYLQLVKIEAEEHKKQFNRLVDSFKNIMPKPELHECVNIPKDQKLVSVDSLFYNLTKDAIKKSNGLRSRWKQILMPYKSAIDAGAMDMSLTREDFNKRFEVEVPKSAFSRWMNDTYKYKPQENSTLISQFETLKDKAL